ncbi:hypothetical protein TIFTF001_038138 [Ficus carica]|uniref:DUF1985 domain-containing protein n=1 Tax=Ficus carica TaxID=3494 RepID=A0AA88E6S7_FICCA|nr:hypothetical protein TIFTF001_038138 [Ficus carica]
MSRPTKMSEKNTTPKRRSIRVTASAYKRSLAEESSKKSAPEIERMVSDEGLKRKHGEIEVKDSKKLISALEEKISEAEEWLSLRPYEAVIHQPCIQQFLNLNTLGWTGHVFHNIVMRLTDHSGMGDALWFEVGEDLFRFSINEFCLITDMKCVRFTHLPQATRAAICNTVEIRMSSKRRPLKKFDKVHYSIAGFPRALIVWAYETLLSIATKFTTKYDQAIPRMLLWITVDNVKFDDVMSAFTAVGENQCFVIMPTEEELKDPWVAQLYSKNPKVVPQLPPKTYVPRPSSDTNSKWREFQKEIR